MTETTPKLVTHWSEYSLLQTECGMRIPLPPGHYQAIGVNSVDCPDCLKAIKGGRIPPPLEFLTRSQLAARWHSCVETIRTRQKAGLIPAVRVGHKWLYRLSEIQRIEATP